MFWIVVGSALAVVCAMAWLYDRKWGGDPTPQHTQARAQADSDAAWTIGQSGGNSGTGS